jgi:hypothetical protein
MITITIIFVNKFLQFLGYFFFQSSSSCLLSNLHHQRRIKRSIDFTFLFIYSISHLNFYRFIFEILIPEIIIFKVFLIGNLITAYFYVIIFKIFDLSLRKFLLNITHPLIVEDSIKK